MKRSIKNVLMVAVIALLSIGMVFTCSYANTHIADNTFASMDGGTPPSMPSNSNEGNGNNSGSDSKKSSGSNWMMPPDNNNNNSQSGSQGTPPAKPSDDNGTPPAKPDGDNTTTSDGSNNNGPTSNGNTPPSRPEDMNTSSSSSKLTWPYYLIFISSSLGIVLLVMHLIMSEFNKKSFKETFTNKDKAMINVLGIIVLTLALSTGSIMLTNNSLSNNGSNLVKPSMGEMNGSNNTSYSATKEITSATTITEGEFTSTNSDENAIMVSGEVTTDISNVTVNKTGNSDGGDNTSFYGTNSGVIAKDGATLNIENAAITTNATGANGVFSYGGSATTSNSSSDGTTVNISNSKITTTKDNSGGIMTTGGGIMNATDLEITTAGTSSAAIRSNRGGGTVNVDGGTYTTTGQGSPAVYSTANITVKNATLKATASEGVVIEGKNSVTLDNVTLVDTNNKLNGQSTTYKNIFLYQSMSGDADTGVAVFKASNSKITTNKGDTLYVTNTKATITLENNTIVNNDTTGNFLRVQKDSWGNSGSNGGDVTLNLTKQKVTGNIVVDSISTLSMSLTNSSSYEGTINKDNSAKMISLTLDKTSKLKLTGDSYITSLNNEDSSNSNIDFNGYKLYVNGDAIN